MTKSVKTAKQIGNTELHDKKTEPRVQVSRFFKRLLLAPIRFYQKHISPSKPPCCRFRPTCSAYAVEAIEKHGALKGLFLALWRILRCNPFCKGGYDPVPPRGRWRPVRAVRLKSRSAPGLRGKRHREVLR